MRTTVLLLAPLPPAVERGLADAFPEVRFTRDPTALPAAVAVLVRGGAPAPGLLRAGASLRWAYSTTPAAEAVAAALPPGSTARVGALREAAADLWADHALTLLLGAAGELAPFLGRQERRLWPRQAAPQLAADRLVVVGAGPPARAIVRTAVRFGLRVDAVGPLMEAGPIAGAEGHPLEALPERLAGAGGVVLSPCLGAAHGRLLTADALAGVAPGGCVVSLAPRRCLDESALARAVALGDLGGAAVSVGADEPLGEASPLATAAGVALLPCLADRSPRYARVLARHFAAGLRRLLDGLAPDAASA